MNTIHKSMETNQVSPLGDIAQKDYVTQKPRGKQLPRELREARKIQEGKNTLSAIANAYGTKKQHLSRVIKGERNTTHLIKILELEYGMGIEQIREIWKRNKDRKASFQELAIEKHLEFENQKGE